MIYKTSLVFVKVVEYLLDREHCHFVHLSSNVHQDHLLDFVELAETDDSIKICLDL